MKTNQITNRLFLTLISLFFAFSFTACEEDIVIAEVPTTFEAISLNQLVETKDPEGVEIPLSIEREAVDVIVVFTNLGDEPVSVSITDNTTVLSIKANATQMMELGEIMGMTILPPTGGSAAVQVDLHYAPTQKKGNNFNIKDKGTGNPICLSGKGTYQPVDFRDCIFEKVKVWSSETPRDISVDFKVTGKTDVVVQVVYENNTDGIYKGLAAPANENLQSVILNEENVIAVYIKGEKNSANGCAPLEIQGTLCYE